MADFEQLNQDYRKIEKALLFLETHFRDQPSLSETARHVGLSEFHFQRLFSRWVGISPKRFLQFLTKEHAKKMLQTSKNILDAAYESGLSGSGRLHDLLVHCEALTPGQLKEKGSGLTIHYGFHSSPFGTCLLALTDRGICHLRFVQESGTGLVEALCNNWPNADIQHSPGKTGPVISSVFNRDRKIPTRPLHIFVQGTNFQIKVWEALLRIPFGTAVAYEDIAHHIGSPGAVRAVGTAIGKNPVPYLIPCHRVVRKMGDFGNFGEGPIRKKAIIGWEAAKSGLWCR